MKKTSQMELVISTIEGEEVYRETADTEIRFTGHLSDGSLIQNGIYFYHCEMRWIVDGKQESNVDTGAFMITCYDVNTCLISMGGQIHEVPKIPSPAFAILLCRIQECDSNFTDIPPHTGSSMLVDMAKAELTE